MYLDQTLIEIERPEGAVYRITRPAGASAQRSAYLPAFDRAVRVTGVDRKDHFQKRLRSREEAAPASPPAPAD